MKRILLFGAILACLLMANNASWARGGGGGGGHGGGGHGGGGHGGGGVRVGVGIGGGFYGGGYYGGGLGLYGGGYPYASSAYYYAPPAYPYPGTPYPATPYPQQFPYPPDGGLPQNPGVVPPMPPPNSTTFAAYGATSNARATPGAMAKPVPASMQNMAPVQLEILLPDASAQLWVDGNLTSTTGRERIFATPALEKGYAYTYTIRIAWVQGGQQFTSERQVNVIPGISRVVDFTIPDLPPPSFAP